MLPDHRTTERLFPALRPGDGGTARPYVSFHARSSSLDPPGPAGPDSAYPAGLVGGALSPASQEPCPGRRVRARSVPGAGLGEEAAGVSGIGFEGEATCPRLCASL